MKITWKANFHLSLTASAIWIGLSISEIASGDAPEIYLRDCWIALLMAYITCLVWMLSKIEQLRSSN
jgi:hypothetical protein